MNIPSELKYTKSHEWIRALEDGAVEVGITDYAQAQLGDIVFVNLPEPGAPVEAGAPLCDLESVKAVADVYCPAGGTIAQVNEALENAPELINNTPYEAWICRIEDVTAMEDTMDADAYAAFCAQEEA